METAIQVKNLQKSYKNLPVLRDISFEEVLTGRENLVMIAKPTSNNRLFQGSSCTERTV